MSAKHESRALLEYAMRDFAALAGMTDQATFADEIFGFVAQQAVEKALKAWIASSGVTFPKTHDVAFLLELLEKQGADTAALLPLVHLNPFAVQFRYDAIDLTEPPIERTKVISDVQTLVDAVAQVLLNKGIR